MQVQGCRHRFTNNLRETQEVRKLLSCTFPQPAANSVNLKRQRCIDRNGWQWAPWTQFIFWWNGHELILTRCCYTSQIIEIFVRLAVYFGQLHIECIWRDTKCIDRNAWLHYCHIFRVLACFDLLEGYATPCDRNDRNLILICRVL